MAYPELPIILVDDDDAFLRTARLSLFAEGLEYVLTMPDPLKVLPCIRQMGASVVCLDLTMPGMDGFILLQEVVAEFPHVPVVVLTGSLDVDIAVACMKAGAKDYQVKPLHPESFAQMMRKQLERLDILEETERLRESLLRDGLENPQAFSHIDTQYIKMKRIFSYAEAISKTGMPVLVTGETGTGKELMAKALHNLRHPRAPFIAVNVAGLDDAVFSDTLFGHLKGAFTGALTDRKGLVESADEGTLFLDEIGDLTPESQVKLLRLIQEGEYYPLGADRPRKVHIWILAATHRPIASMSTFRKDLYYRLQSHCINLPPLRERLCDLPLLVFSTLEKAGQQMGRVFSTHFAHNLVKRIIGYEFPGNVRELQGMVFDVAGSASRDEIIDEDVLRRWIGTSKPVEDSTTSVSSMACATVQFGEKLPSLREVEDLLIHEALLRTKDNKTVAAALLGVSRQTLLNRFKRAHAETSDVDERLILDFGF